MMEYSDRYSSNMKRMYDELAHITAREQIKGVSKILLFLGKKDEKFKNDKLVEPTQLLFFRNDSFDHKTALDFLIFCIKRSNEINPKTAYYKYKTLSILQSIKLFKRPSAKKIFELFNELYMQQPGFKRVWVHATRRKYNNKELYLFEDALYCLLIGLDHYGLYDFAKDFVYNADIENDYRYKWHNKLYDNFLDLRAFFEDYNKSLTQSLSK